MHLTSRRLGASAALLAGALLAATPAGCGARTGLAVDDAGPDALVDLEPDAGPDARPDAKLDAKADAPQICKTNEECELALDVLDRCNPVGCVEGKCSPLPPVVCDDKDPCTRDECDPLTGKCSVAPLTFDLDKDGFKGPAPGFKPGEPGSCGDDCDDTSPLAFPGGKEVCDGVDNDCNGIVDDDAKFVPISLDPTLVSEPSLTKGYAGGIAYAGVKQGYLAAYTGETGGNTNIYMRPISPVGQPGAPISQVNSTTGDAYGGPMVWTGDRHGMVWQDRRDNNYEIYFNTFAPDGPKLGPDVRVTIADGFSINPGIAWNGTSFFLVWQDDSSGSFEVLAQKVSLEAKLVGPQINIAADLPAVESPSIAASPLGVGIVYRVGDTETSTIYFQGYNADLAPTGPRVELASGANYIDPYVIPNGPQFVVVWGQKLPFKVFGAVLDPKGAVVIPKTEISPPGAPSRRALPLALGDRIIVVYSRQVSDGYNLFSRTFSKSLVPLSDPQTLTTKPGDDLASALVFGPGGDVAVFFDGKLGDPAGLKNAAYLTRLQCAAGK